jgi:D-beta-D-heptose 7-phosphate kinase/D-beta-D-heptose 1-phosphate adenosyltransferase
MSKKIVVASGYFDPLHSGHVEYLQKSKQLGDVLIVIVNNDRQAQLKKGNVFMSCKERIQIVRALACVDCVVESIDEDRSVCRSIAMLHPHIFAKGGDQTIGTIPELDICNQLGVTITDGLGNKIQSSRHLLAQMKKNLTNISDDYLQQI